MRKENIHPFHFSEEQLFLVTVENVVELPKLPEINYEMQVTVQFHGRENLQFFFFHQDGKERLGRSSVI